MHLCTFASEFQIDKAIVISGAFWHQIVEEGAAKNDGKLLKIRDWTLQEFGKTQGIVRHVL